MNIRTLGNGGPRITECGLGCWQLGGGWGRTWDDGIAQAILDASYQEGVRFFDTADVYGDGNCESERSIARFRARHSDIYIATKLGRKDIYPTHYTRDTLRDATLGSIERLGVERLDLTQLHCIPHAELTRGKVFEWLQEQKQEGIIADFGASVESVEEGLTCLQYEGIRSLQIIFNIYRQKPLNELFPLAKEKGVGIIVRLPLASGLLSGTMNRHSRFREGDHRNFNKDGTAFNVGETFAGLVFEKGIELTETLQHIPAVAKELRSHHSLAQLALRWILDYDAVSVVIPGASSASQAIQNAGASRCTRLSSTIHDILHDFYRSDIHQHIRGAY